MKEALKTASSWLTKKLVFWIGGLIGLAGFIYIFVFIIILILVIGAVATTNDTSKSSDSGGKYVCSSTGDIDKGMWDQTFSGKGGRGVLKNQGDTIIRLAEQEGIDPVLFASIAFHETTWGTSNGIKNYNNPGGLMNPSTNWQTQQHFGTLEEGLEAMAKTLKNLILNRGLVTVEDLGQVYAPVPAKNDPTGLNKNWVPTTNSIASELGGLTMNCEASDGIDFIIDGNASELRKNIASVGTKWVGKTRYHWGGGRNPQAAARGEYDCSSFVHWAYKENGIELGHISGVSTETLNKMGTRINISEIQVGDLIFWDSYKKDGHVAIYIGDGKFIGSQSSTGVGIEPLNHSYWSPIFSGHVRRLIND